MAALRVVMRPVDDAAFLVPNILAVEPDAVTDSQSVDARGDVDVVRYQHCLPRLELKDESLMSLPVHIVWQKTNHSTFIFDLYVACTTRECATDGALVDSR